MDVSRKPQGVGKMGAVERAVARVIDNEGQYPVTTWNTVSVTPPRRSYPSHNTSMSAQPVGFLFIVSYVVISRFLTFQRGEYGQSSRRGHRDKRAAQLVAILGIVLRIPPWSLPWG